MVRLTDRPDMTLDVYHGGKTTIQQQQLSDVPAGHFVSCKKTFMPFYHADSIIPIT